MSSLTLQEIAQASLNLLGLGLKAPEYKTESFTEAAPGPRRTWTVETWEEGLETWTCIKSEGVYQSIGTGPHTPAPLNRIADGSRRSESPLLSVKREQSISVENQLRMSEIPMWRDLRDLGSPSDLRITTRSCANGSSSRASRRGHMPPRAASRIKKRASRPRFMLRSTISTRSRRVTRFYALNSKGKPVRLT